MQAKHLRPLAALLLGLTALATGPAHAQTGAIDLLVAASAITDVSGQATIRPEGLTVDDNGIIFALDRDSDTLYRITPGVTPTVEAIATYTEMYDAIDAVNGSTPVTAYNPRIIDTDSDGDIIVVGFTSGFDFGDSLISLTPTIPTTISVIHTSVNSSNSAISGMTSMTVLGTTAYVGTDDSFGFADTVVTIDTNATGPAAPTAELVSQADLIAVIGNVDDGGEAGVALNALTNDGSFVYGIASEAAASTDDVVEISTTTGQVSIVATGAEITAALAALDGGLTTDVGFGAIGIDADNDIYLANPFGNAESLFDGSLVLIVNQGTIRERITGVPLSDLIADLGLDAAYSPFLGNDGLHHDPVSNQMLLSEESGIVAHDASGGLLPGDGGGGIGDEPVLNQAHNWMIYE